MGQYRNPFSAQCTSQIEQVAWRGIQVRLKSLESDKNHAEVKNRGTIHNREIWIREVTKDNEVMNIKTGQFTTRIQLSKPWEPISWRTDFRSASPNKYQSTTWLKWSDCKTRHSIPTMFPLNTDSQEEIDDQIRMTWRKRKQKVKGLEWCSYQR